MRIAVVNKRIGCSPVKSNRSFINRKRAVDIGDCIV